MGSGLGPISKYFIPDTLQITRPCASITRMVCDTCDIPWHTQQIVMRVDMAHCWNHADLAFQVYLNPQLLWGQVAVNSNCFAFDWTV